MTVLPEAAAAPTGSSSLALRSHSPSHAARSSSPDVRMASPSLDARSPRMAPVSSHVNAPPAPARSPSAASEDYHESDEELLDQILDWGDLLPQRPAPTRTPTSGTAVPQHGATASVVASTSDETSPATRAADTSTAASQPASVAWSASALQELIDEVRLEWPSDEEDGPAEDDAAASPSHSGLTDDSDDDDEPIRPRRSRLRRGDEDSSWHPELPRPPDKHLVTNHRNHYKPDEAWDYRAMASITRLLDARGDPPHRCYLVQWKGRPLQMSWVWMEHLDNATTRYLMQQVDQWQAEGNTGPYFPVQRDTASESGKCFMDAFRAALYYLVSPDLVTLEMWDAFEAMQPDDILGGVTRSDVTAFFKVLQRDSVPLDYDHLFLNVAPRSIANIETFNKVCQEQPPGVYLVSAGEDDVGHCFVVIVYGPNERVLVLDGFTDKKDPPMDALPLKYLQWVHNVKWICRVALKPGYQCRHGKRKSKTQWKREKRLR
ncbi:hypothetical protein PI124_g4814 [Phytophthora idaei]|nr:hypothetical protein PI125_g2325 [Phytophthora idaei]KAG3165761.1 hypothetical protein PI126_g4508 [Phytophthora idaei]KAG3250559.1 hypothetical protein PI124_g4814 [Phytophthora idaei]